MQKMKMVFSGQPTFKTLDVSLVGAFRETPLLMLGLLNREAASSALQNSVTGLQIEWRRITRRDRNHDATALIPALTSPVWIDSISPY